VNRCFSSYDLSDVDFDGRCCKAELEMFVGYVHEGPCCNDVECGECSSPLIRIRERRQATWCQCHNGGNCDFSCLTGRHHVGTCGEA
jgi:hypothetical protein